MTMKLVSSLLLLLFMCFSFSNIVFAFIPHRTLLLNNFSKGLYLTQKELWLNQTLDHFSPYDNRQFQQRYYECLDHFRSPDGPIFLVICGEDACSGISPDYTVVLAKKFGAAVVSLEHRYYGLSTPFDTLSTENLKYLSSKQTLFDLAVFRQYYQDSLNAKWNRKGVENPWFVFGGSYAGALSAWFRLKFPHLTCGSLASSAVILAIQDYTEFDQQVGESAGPECKAVLQETTKLIETKLATNGKALRATFNATRLVVDGDLLYYMADAAATAIQYGNPDILCKPMVEAKKVGEDLVEAYAKYVKSDYVVAYYGGNVRIYDREYLKRTEINEDSYSRLWWFQVCTEIGYFQVPPSNDTIRSSKIDTKYHLDLWTKIAGSKIIFTNGSQDPWRHASKQTSSPDMPSYLITCNNCGHCTDLVGCAQGNIDKKCNSAVHKARQKIQEDMKLWLSECISTQKKK
ncbi:Serine carboxypeptidase S28 family protein [Trifolium repens]|nr:Serine carboxypeptidase S28 family protein [Trifolium repens]